MSEIEMREGTNNLWKIADIVENTNMGCQKVKKRVKLTTLIIFSLSQCLSRLSQKVMITFEKLFLCWVPMNVRQH